MTNASKLPLWTIAAPIVGWLLLGGTLLGWGGAYIGLLAVGLIGSVLAAVHHAEVVAHKVGEPYGTLVLAIAVTVIEVALIVSLMLAGGPATLARDTVFAAVMIILTGMVGICMLVGGLKHGEQRFRLDGASGALVTLAAIAILTMVLPNYTETTPGPFYSRSQLAFIALVTLVLYGTFVLVQTVRHRDYFLPRKADGSVDEDEHADPPTTQAAWLSFVLLLACLVAVVLLAKSLAGPMEVALTRAGAPQALLGIIIAAVVLLPEGLAAARAARANRLQNSLNLALGSALASIGLTIPTVAVLSLSSGWTLALGLDSKATVLLLLSLFLATISFSTGRTTILQGVVHLVLFAVYLFTTVVP
ncbi:Sodium-potassium/proton antiporter ChaA [Usitatibacter rugosus]|uniref:Sodium-potassium/proton antiporter ChaA n=1 Tax=Usitatibacter rugosus TaxID=2732067 RepID=A0A6M4GY64_9PROT|nr:ionic transporter y4hA [Usitatibacter rugosus]QJR12230.1 Sodium-potassium/proton antiporter ChaA [Usitatibacter rugosus]